MNKEIEKYWNVSPPMYAENGEPGTLEWSKSIIEDRKKYAPYLEKFMIWDNYRNKDVLEIGCGSGSDTISLLTAGARVTALDITDNAVQITKQRTLLHGFNSDTADVSVVKYNGRQIPYEDNTFDVVYSCGVLHHTPYMENLLSEARRVLRSDGDLKLMLYHRESLLYYYSILYRNIMAGSTDARDYLLSRYSEFREGCPYTRCFSRVEIMDMLNRMGFYNAVIYTDSVVYDEGSQRKLDGNRIFTVKPTGFYDIDLFFESYNYAVANGSTLDDWGWHLLVTAFK